MTKSKFDLPVAILFEVVVAIGGVALNIKPVGHFLFNNAWVFFPFLAVIIGLIAYI